MRIITTADGMREYSLKARQDGKTIGFVPTMGYLHQGHLSLIEAARSECDLVVMSIFVNPTQFGPGEDYEKYPRDMERDKKLAESVGVDVVFAPSVQEMYPDGQTTSVEVTERLTDKLCGRSRPGHFKGVTTVVAKLFDIVAPDRSYFGQKDAQQAVVIKRMVKDLDLATEVRVMPIVREPDGLAMSSRNTYLSRDERREALGLYRSLKKAEEMIASGQRKREVVEKEIRSILEKGKDLKIDYVGIVDVEDLEPIEEIRDNTLIALAVFIGKTRLIDNIVIKKAS